MILLDVKDFIRPLSQSSDKIARHTIAAWLAMKNVGTEP